MIQKHSISRISLGSALAAVAISILWGGNVIAMKLGLGTFPPFWSAFWRMLAGVVAVGLWGAVRNVAMAPPAGERPLILGLGVLFTVQITTLTFGVDLTSPAYSIVLLNAHPVFANLVGHFFVAEDKLSPVRVLGLATAFAGICFVFLGRPETTLASHPYLGNFVVVTSAFLLGSRTVYTQRLVQSIEPVRAVFWQMALSLPVFLAAGLILEPPLIRPLEVAAVLAILYQGIVIAGLCFIVWTVLLTRMSPGTLSMFAFISPVSGLFLSVLFFGEPITARLFGGLVAVAAGIWLVTRRPGRASAGLASAPEEPAR